MAGETYSVEVKCANCGQANILQIPKGVLVVDYARHEMQELACDGCGCNLRRVTISGQVWRP